MNQTFLKLVFVAVKHFLKKIKFLKEYWIYFKFRINPHQFLKELINPINRLLKILLN